MKKQIIFLVLALMGLTLMAKPVEPATAVQVARHFALTQQGAKQRAFLGDEPFADANVVYTHPMPESGRPAMYVVNLGSAFVIVAADDVAHPILGYNMGRPWPTASNDGGKSNNRAITQSSNLSLPSQVSGFLDDLANQINAALQQNVAPDRGTASEWQQLSGVVPMYSSSNIPDSVGPLLTTTWDQGQYYNALCPEDTNGPAGHALTGCVATAMAQIINYWGYPVHGRGTHSYQSNYGTLTVNYDSATYDYANMPSVLTATSTPAQVNAVAKLMRDCGVAANMQYGSTESSSYDIDARAGMINFFRISPDASYAEKSYFSDTDWNNLIQTNLSSNRPVMYSGQGTGGHTFVCDGYNANDYYHFNFGWSGYADGWYITSAVNPSGMDFNSSQHIIVGIVPDSMGNMIIGQTIGNSTFIVDNPIFFLSPLYCFYYDFNIGNTVTFMSSDSNINMICDVLNYEESVIQYIEIFGDDEYNYVRRLGYNDFGDNDYSTIETNANTITFDINGQYNSSDGFVFYVRKENYCRFVSDVVLNGVISDTTGTSVSIAWTDNDTNTDSGVWQIRYRTHTTPVDSASIINVSTNPYTLTGLSKGELYHFCIRNQCEIDADIWGIEQEIVVDVPHWTDIVTTQPMGYIEDSNGNVEISTAEGLAWLSVKTNGLHNQPKDNYFNKRIRIVSDIDLRGYRWFPIASNATNHYAQFKGVFDGCNHTISNIQVVEHKTQKCGLFALFEGDTIRNTIISGTVKNMYFAIPEQGGTGGLVGAVYGGIIENCHSSVNVYGLSQIGSLCGYSDNKIINSSSEGFVYGRADCGGLLGFARPGTEIVNCYSNSNVLSNNSADLFYCIAYQSKRGGLVGYAQHSNIENCYSSGTVEPELGGYAYGTLVGEVDYVTSIKNIYGLKNASMQIVGFIESSCIVNDTSSFILNSDTCILSTSIHVNGNDFTDMTDAMNAWIYKSNNSDYRLWVYDTIYSNYGYPVFGDFYEPTCYNPRELTVSNSTNVGDTIIRTSLMWEQSGNPDHWEILYVPHRHSINEGTIVQVASNPCILSNVPTGNPLDFYVRAVCGDGDTSGWSSSVVYIPDKLYWIDVVTSQPAGYQEAADGSIHIYSPEGLAWLSRIHDIQFAHDIYLESDIDMSQYRWSPIGGMNQPLMYCVFDGKNHTISGLYCNDLKDNLGLFGYVTSSTLKNIFLTNCYIAGTSSISAITANAWDSEIINCGASGEIDAWACAGGIVADAPFSSVKNTFFNGNVVFREDMYCYLIPGYFGGVANHVSAVENCYFTGIIPEMVYCGLITYTANSVDTINNCYCKNNGQEIPFTIDIPSNNLSYFTGFFNNWTLSNPSSINGISYSNLVDALNAWVDENNTDGQYFHWLADTANVNGGFPLFDVPSCFYVPRTFIEPTITACDSYTFNGVTYTESASINDTLQAVNGCDSISSQLILINHPVHYYYNDARVCEGETYTFNGRTLTETNWYYDTIVNGAANGCDSIVALWLEVRNPTSWNYPRVCEGETYTFNGRTLTETGSYYDTIVNGAANGCDSIVYLWLEVQNPTSWHFPRVCEGETYNFNGRTLTETGSYYDTITNGAANGCDSIVYLWLEVRNNYSYPSAEICQGENYLFAGQQLTESGTYFDTLTNVSANGCDSIVQLNFTVHPTYYLYDTIYVPDGSLPYLYTYRDWSHEVSDFSITMSSNTLVVDTRTNPSGTIYDNGGPNGNYSDYFDGTIILTADEGETIKLSGSYQLEGCCDYISVYDGYGISGNNLFYTCGTGSVDVQSNTGYLTIRFTSDGSVNYAGFALQWNTQQSIDTLLAAAGDYTFEAHTSYGCDNTFNLHLEPRTAYSRTDSVSVCSNSLPYAYADTLIADAGIYTFSYLDRYGIDSTVTLHLTVNYSVVVYDSLAITSADLPYDYYGNSIDAEGDYTFADMTAAGCDSTTYLNVTVSQIGIDDVGSADGIKVYPNPTGGLLTVEGSDLQRIELMDMTSRTVLVGKCDIHAGSCNLDLSALPQGAYMLRITTVDGVAIRKVVKQ